LIRSSLILSAIVLINLIGMFYGYYYYYEQLSASPASLWLFIPDCPLYVMLFTIALLLTLFGFEYKLLSYIAAVGMMKYGVWTLTALLLFSDYFFSRYLWLLSSILFILHIGMFSEGPLLIPKKLGRAHLAAGLFWFLANDYFDYFYRYLNVWGEYVLGTHPILPSADRIPVMMVLTFALSILMSLLAYWLSSMNISWPARRELDDAREYFQKIRKRSRGSRRRSR